MSANGHAAASAPPAGPAMRPPGPPPGAPPGQPFQAMPYGAFPPGPPPGMPPAMPNFPPPLPPGWSEHTAPDGVRKYFYNTHTKESRWVRPTFPGPFPAPPAHFPPFPPAANVNAVPSSSSTPPPEKKEKKKKEKPKEKVPIPGTTWTRVTTTEGNVFYFEKESKKSEWSVPEEIKDQVAELEKEEAEQKEEARRKEEEEKEKERLERLKEQERVRLEIVEERKRFEERRKEMMEKKRKERERDEEENGEAGTKKPRVIDGEDEGGEHGEAGGEEGGGMYGPQDEEDEEEWMKAVAAEFAAADAETAEDKKKEEEETKISIEEAAKKVFQVPEKVSVSIEEQRALFKALLIEKDISPFASWDQSLPLFINDPRYILLSSQKDRRDVYEEYCREAGRARRLKKAAAPASASNGDGDKKADPEREYKALLREEVTSTRTRWEEFRKKWKKERRFYAFGRDDREREKAFKVHLKELGERKRADAQRAETDFFELLKEASGITPESKWQDVKKGVNTDPRYDAVNSSSLREELFNAYLKKLGTTSGSSGTAAAGHTETPEEAAERKLKERKAKAEQSLKEREAKVREEKERVGKEVGRSRMGAGREEAERLFGSLLVDQVRDHETTWEESSKYLSKDPRFDHPSLRLGDKLRLFNEHLARISSKRSNALHDLFASHSPDILSTPFDTVYPEIAEDPIVKRLALSPSDLESRFNAWRRGQEDQARREFDVMLGENSFVEFWGKMRKKVLDEQALQVKEEDEGLEEGEGMGEGGSADLTALAKGINLEEIKSVLRRDRRYRVWDHKPEVREQWLRDYLENLEAASGSRTIHNVGAGLNR